MQFLYCYWKPQAIASMHWLFCTEPNEVFQFPLVIFFPNTMIVDTHCHKKTERIQFHFKFTKRFTPMCIFSVQILFFWTNKIVSCLKCFFISGCRSCKCSFLFAPINDQSRFWNTTKIKQINKKYTARQNNYISNSQIRQMKLTE